MPCSTPMDERKLTYQAGVASARVISRRIVFLIDSVCGSQVWLRLSRLSVFQLSYLTLCMLVRLLDDGFELLGNAFEGVITRPKISEYS